MGLKDLKAFIGKAGLSTVDCIDKDDLRARAKEAAARLASSAGSASSTPAAAASGGAGTTLDNKSMGSYPCIIKGPADLLAADAAAAPADMLVVMLHGLGASNTDLADVLPVFAQSEPELGRARIVQVFPQAPMSPIGAAWWQIDVMSFMQAQMTGNMELLGQLIRKKPDGLDACRANFATLLEEARLLAGGGTTPLPAAKVLLAGFSLGSITALDTALQCAPAQHVAGVLFMHGAPICVDEWAERLKHHPGLRVYMTAGQADMTLPHQTAGWVKQLLDANGAKAEMHVHPGGHELGGPDVIRRIAKFVRETLEFATKA